MANREKLSWTSSHWKMLTATQRKIMRDMAELPYGEELILEGRKLQSAFVLVRTGWLELQAYHENGLKASFRMTATGREITNAEKSSPLPADNGRAE